MDRGTSAQGSDEQRISRRAVLKVAGVGAASLALGGMPRFAWAQQGLPSEITVVLLGPLTGGLADTGQKIREGAELFIKQVNASGGIGGRTRINAVFGDSQGNPSEGATVVRRMITRDRIQFLAGDFSSSVSLAIQPILAQSGILHAAYAYAPQLTARGIRTTFRVGPWAGVEMAPLARYAVVDQGHRRFSILAQNDDWGRSMVSEFKRVAVALRPETEFVSEDYYNFGTTDFTSYLTKVRGLAPEGLLAINYEPEAILVTRQYHQLRLEAQIYGSDLYAGTDYGRQVGDQAEGIYYTDFWWRHRGEGPAKVRQFYEDYAAEYGRDPDMLTVWGYTALDLLKQAAEATGTVETDALVDYFLSGATFSTLLGDYSFAACGQAQVTNGVGTWRDGRQAYVTEKGYAIDMVSYCP